MEAEAARTEREQLLETIRREAKLLKGSAPTTIDTYYENGVWFAGARNKRAWAEIRVSDGPEASEIDALRRLLAAFRLPLLAQGYLPEVRT